MAFLTATQARTLLHCSKKKMADLIREGTLPTHADPLNKRRKLIDELDVKKIIVIRAMVSTINDSN